MATIAPFRGVRFAGGGDLSKLLAPPYDVISESEHRAYSAAHPHNIINLTLGAPGGKKRDYGAIGNRLRRWIRERVLVQEPEKCFYAYCQEWSLEGHRIKFWGLLGLLKLEKFGRGSVYPHEKVNPGPVDDRLRVMESTRANLEPIMALYRQASDPMNLLYASMEGLAPVMSAALSNGTRHRIWKLPLRQTCVRIQRMARRLPFFIADGHHRYNSGWLFHQRHRRLDGAAWIMTLIGNVEQKGLRIMPINRVITTANPVKADLIRSMERFGRVERIGRKMPQILFRLPRNTLGFYGRRVGSWLLHLPPLPANTEPRTTLEVVRLHEILPQVLEIRELAYTKKAAEDMGQATRNPRVLAGFLPAPSPQTVCAVAFSNELLPQKSTFFLPKPQSGLVLRLI